MATVIFYGDLKRFANEPLVLDVANFRELMSGLLSQLNGFQQHIRDGYYKVRLGKNKYLTQQQLEANPEIALSADCTVHFTPVIAGAGKAGGILQVVAGVVLIVVGALNIWNFGSGAIAAGIGLLIGGAVTLMTKAPNMPNGVAENEKKQSTSFSNIQNLTPQGRPIPLLYGEMMTSLILISQGIETFDDMEDLAKTSVKKTHKRKAILARG